MQCTFVKFKEKKIQELHSDYPLAPDEIEIKRKMLPEYQLKIADLYNIPIDNVKKIVPNFSDKEKYIIRYENLKLYLSLGLKPKKIHFELEFNQSQLLNPYIEFNSQKKNKSRKKRRQGWKTVVQIND